MIKLRTFTLLTVAAGCYTIFAWAYIHGYRAGVDWRLNFRAPALEFLSTWQYSSAGNINYPPWLYIGLAPLAILPEYIGAVLVALACMISFAFVAWRHGFSWRATAIFLLMPQMLFLSTNGNIDWLVALGLVMPPWLGLFFVLIKPQVGLAVASFWVWQAWRQGGPRRLLATVAPVAAAYLLCIWLWGLRSVLPPVARFSGLNRPWDADIWPVGLAMGLLLMYKALRGVDFKKAILAGPFFSPYVAFYSWPVAMLGLGSSWELIIASYGAWLVWIVSRATGPAL